MLPNDYTVIWARNFPSPDPQVVNAVSHHFDGHSLLLKTYGNGNVAFYEPLEWWREDSAEYDGEIQDLFDFFEKSSADFVYTVESRHAGRVVRVAADSDEEDGETLRLMLSGKTEAQFDRPHKWSRHERMGRTR